MTIIDRLFRGASLAVIGALLVVACGGDKPEALLASARDYLARNDPKTAVIQVKNALQKDPGSAEGRFLLGKALLQTGDPAGAEVELRKAMDAKYPADQVVPLLAQALLSTGQSRKILSDLAKIDLASPEARADLRTTVAMSQAALGQLDKARASTDEALAIKPDHARAMLLKARLMLANKDTPGALGFLDSVLAQDAKNHEAWGLKGYILAVQGRDQESLAAYRKAVEVKPDYADGHTAIVTTLLRQDKLEEAGAQLAAMKQALPKSPQTLLVEAEYLYQKKDFKQALELTQALLRGSPDNPKVLLLAGTVQFQLNSLAQAEDHLSRALKRAPDAIAIRRMLAMTYLRMGQPAKALSAVEPVLEQGDKDSGLLSLAGDIYAQNGDLRKAEEYFSKAAALDPKNAAKQTKLALAHMVEGKGDTAFGELERIASADTGTTADMALIASAFRGKDFVKAMKAIDGLERKRPNDPLVHALRGAVMVAKGDLAAGRKSFEKALEIKPGYFPAAASLASLDLKEGKSDDAKKRFESVLAAEPKNFQASLALAELKARTGASPDDVAAVIGKAIQVNPNELAPRLALINFHLQRKEAKKAVAVGQDAAAALPDRVEVLDALARAQQVAGDPNQALATCGKMVALMPGSPQPYVRMAEVNVSAKDNAAAIQNLNKALDLQPDLILAQRGLVMLFLEAQNFKDAENVAAEVKRQRPKEAVGYLLDGDIAAARKAWPEAAAAYRAGLREVPATELAIKVYVVQRADGKVDEAEKFANAWLADHPKDAAFRLAMAESAAAQKEFAKAIRHYQILLQTQPNNPMLLNNVAWTLGQLRDPKALEYAERANRIAPNQAAIMETLGSLLAEKGDFARGLELLQKAVDLAPQSAILKLSLARAQVKAGKTADARKQLNELAKLGDKFPAQADVARLLGEIGN